MLNLKFKRLFMVEEENGQLGMKVLEKDLEVESLKKELKVMKDKIRVLESEKEPEKEVFVYHKNVQQFHDEFRTLFGEVDLSQLRAKMDFMEKTFFEKQVSMESRQF